MQRHERRHSPCQLAMTQMETAQWPCSQSLHPIPWIISWTAAHTILSKVQIHKLMYFTNLCIMIHYEHLWAWRAWIGVKAGHICICLLIMACSIWDNESVGVGLQRNNNSTIVCFSSCSEDIKLTHSVKISITFRFEKKKKQWTNRRPNF